MKNKFPYYELRVSEKFKVNRIEMIKASEIVTYKDHIFYDDGKFKITTCHDDCYVCKTMEMIQDLRDAYFVRKHFPKERFDCLVFVENQYQLLQSNKSVLKDIDELDIGERFVFEIERKYNYPSHSVQKLFEKKVDIEEYVLEKRSPSTYKDEKEYVNLMLEELELDVTDLRKYKLKKMELCDG
jgi:hypothetical protein